MFRNQRRLPKLILLIAIAVAPLRVSAAISGTLAEGGTRGDWAMVTLQFPALKAAGEIQLRDNRGGLRIICTLPAGSRSTTFSMPLIAPAGLAGGPWTLDARLIDGGELLEEARVLLPLATQQSTFRIAVPQGTPADIMANLPRKTLSDIPITFVEMSDADFAESSPAVFAACDGVLLTPAIARKLSSARRQALLCAGVHLISSDDPAPAAAAPLRRPVVVLPELSQVDAPTAEADPRIRRGLLLLGPAAIVAALIARGLFKKPQSVHLAVTCAMLAVPALFIEVIHRDDFPVVAGFHFCEGAASGSAMLDEYFFAQGTFFRGSFELNAPDRAMLLPQFASARAYFAAPETRLALSGPQQLTGEQPARGVNWFVQLSAREMPGPALDASSQPPRADLLRRWSIDSAHAWWVSGGYVSPASGPAPAGAEGLLVSKWAMQQSPSIAQAARAWEALRLQGTHDYLLWQDGEHRLHIMDVGVAK